jgi:hypothetical protein
MWHILILDFKTFFLFKIVPVAECDFYVIYWDDGSSQNEGQFYDM